MEEAILQLRFLRATLGSSLLIPHSSCSPVSLLELHLPTRLHLYSLTHASAWRATTSGYFMKPSAYWAAKLTKLSWKATSPPFSNACKQCSTLMSATQ